MFFRDGFENVSMDFTSNILENKEQLAGAVTVRVFSTAEGDGFNSQSFQELYVKETFLASTCLPYDKHMQNLH